MLTLGLFGANMGACAAPEASVGVGVLAEELGFDSVWMGEHVVAPRPHVRPSPIAPDYPILDPLIALGFVAARTRRIRLGTGIVILPQRNPVVLAKQVASLDVLSGGRLVFGIGVGYLEPEMRAIGVPMEHRGTRSDEYLQAMRSLWMDEAPEFHGTYVDFEGVDAHPRPVQRPLPVVVGGRSAAAHRRTARYADGWYGFMLGREETAEQIESLRFEAREAGRNPDEIEITVSPSEPLDRAVVADYEQLGVHRLALVPPPEIWTDDASREDIEGFVRDHAPERLGARPQQSASASA